MMTSPATVEEGLATLAALAAVGFQSATEPAGAEPRVPRPRARQRVDGQGAAGASAEHGRRVAEARYGTLIEQIPAVTFFASLTGGSNEIYVSPQIETLLGFTQQEWVSDPVLWYRQTHPDDRDRVSREFAELCLTGKPFRDVIRVITRGGDTLWVHAEARLVRDEAGQLLFLQGVGFDISDQYRARQAREELIREQGARAEADRERDRLREVFTGLPAAIALLRGPDYVVEFLNPVALELAGGDPAAVGKPFREAFGQFAEASTGVVDRVMATGQQSSAREICISDDDGQTARFFNVMCQPMHDDRGLLLLTHAVEVTEQVLARREVEDALQLRDEFLSIASHELKTPISALQGQAQLIMRRADRGQLDAGRVRHAFQSIIGQAGKLSRLVGQLLDVSRLQAGKLELEVEPTDLVALVESVAAVARTATDRHVILVDAPKSLVAETDALRLEQVLTNLLDNARKYSPDGGEIEVGLARSGRDAVELSVRDHGLGIPPEKRGAIFERFYQAHGSGNRSGLGLGLYISRQIVEMHGGTIRAEFPPSGGTRFRVCLPVRARSDGCN